VKFHTPSGACLHLALEAIADAPTEGIAFVEEQGGFGVDEGGAGDGWSNFTRSAVEPAKTACESAAENAFLNPRFVFCEFFVGREAGELCARAGAARRAIIGFAGALDEIAGVRAGNGWWTEQFNVIDLRKALAVDGLTNLPANFGKLFRICKSEVVAVFFGEEKPVAAPGDIAANWTYAGDFGYESGPGAPTGNIFDGDGPIVVKGGGDNSDGRFDSVFARFDTAHISESCDQSDGTVTAHAEVAHVVEEYNASGAGEIGRFEQSSADDDIRAAGFVYDG